ncbi:hypothetical protein PoB_003892200 [Plakobranchus ocellatus]|uniref:Uncharacterized protein n=1 Tax=Plakobranchus ocellatus TaxID=259542 RepID=A0AAV4AZG8_9GAST|nr:hypothetical protein PoB_003892200 [Plakobranchus ocellatus]
MAVDPAFENVGQKPGLEIFRIEANGYLQSLRRNDAVQFFRARARHTLLLSDRARDTWSATSARGLYGEGEGTIPHVLSECRESVNVRPTRWATMSLSDIFWRQDRVDMNAAGNILRMFLGRAMQKAGEQAPVLTSNASIRAHPSVQEVEQRNHAIRPFSFIWESY